MWNRFITYLVLNLNIKKNLGRVERTILTSCSTTSASPRLTRHGIFSNEGERESDVSIIRVWTELIQGYLHRPHLEYHFEFGPRLASKFRVFDTNLKLHSVPTKKKQFNQAIYYLCPTELFCMKCATKFLGNQRYVAVQLVSFLRLILHLVQQAVA